MELKKQFLDYLRQVYGAESMVTSQSLPPLEVGPNYPAFQTGNLNGGLMGLAGMQQPGMGMMGAQGGLGGLQGRPQVGGPRQAPVDDSTVRQNLLLGS